MADLNITWDDILWAAVTVGRPNRHYVFRHGDASLYEALFRWSLVRMSLEQSGRAANRLRRTGVAKTLDPTEKGAVNYFLGLIFCKLFAWKLLSTPWLLHLDVFRPRLDPILKGRSRPDLVGKEHGTSHWHAFECKGRASPADSTAKAKAKLQARRLVSVKGTPCFLHVGAITHFRRDVVNFYWCDPLPKARKELDVPFSGDLWRFYYGPLVEISRRTQPDMRLEGDGAVSYIDGVDIELRIHRVVADYLFNEQWERAQQAAVEARIEIADAGYHPDGISVKAGDSWYGPYRESDASRS